MPEGLFIKPVNLQDEEEVLFIFACRRHPDVAKHLFKPPPDDYELHKAYLKKNVPDKVRMYVAKSEAILVGYCHAYGFAGDEVELGFVVHPDWQGQGFGSGMVDLLVKEVTAIFPSKQIHLEVKADNKKAIKLYEKHGFIKKSIRMDFK